MSTRMFVSVLDIVNSIASQVPIDEVDARLPAILQSRRMPHIDNIGSSLHRRAHHTLMLDAYRTSEAAAALEAYLRDAVDSRPRWFDWGQTGRSRLNACAGDEAMAALIHLSKYDQRCKEAWESGAYKDQGYLGAISVMRIGDKKFRNADEKDRLQNIGFERAELIEFLERHGIPYAIDCLAGTSHPVVPLLFESDTVTNTEGDSASEQFQAQRLLQATADDEPQRSLTTAAMAAAFSDGNDCKYQTGKEYQGWKDYLQKSPPAWAEARDIKVRKGKRGRNGTALWNPLEFAKAYVSKQNTKQSLTAFGERFRKIGDLSHWKDDWTRWAADQKDRLESGGT